MSDGNKTAHVAGAGLLAFGALFARLGDDCGRIGARGASALDDAARFGRASSLADDGARGLGRTGSLADDGMHLARAPVVVDERVGLELVEHARGGELAEAGVDVSLEILSNIDPAPATAHDRPRPRERTYAPGLVTLLPDSPAARARVYGESDVPQDSRPAPDAFDLPARLERWRGHDPVGLLLYATGPLAIDRPLALALPDGRLTDDLALHRACLARDLWCVVLACPAEQPAARGDCAEAAYAIWSAATGGDRSVGAPLRDVLGRLLDARARSDAGRGIVVSRLEDVAGANAPGVVRSKLRGR